jgi:hypothetical protein
MATAKPLAALTITAIAAGLAWHYADRLGAVRAAVAGYVAEQELSALRAELAEARRLRAITERQRARLSAQRELDQKRAEEADAALAEYIQTVDQNPLCRVDDDFLDRLPNHFREGGPTR